MSKSIYKMAVVLTFLLLVFGQIVSAQQGGLDLTFGGGTGIYQDDKPTLPLPAGPGDVGRGYGVNEILANGKIIVAGSATLSYINNNGNGGYASDFLVRRLNADGSVDTNFGANGEARTTFYRWGAGSYERSNNPTYTMKVQPSDGKIILASMCSVGGAPDPNTQLNLGNDLCMIRYNANGTLDTSFGGNTVTVRSGATVTQYTMEGGKVWTQTGTNFINANDTVRSAGGTPVKIQIAPDGRIFVFGNSRDDIVGGNSNGGGRAKGFVAIYSTNGTLQTINSIIDTSGNNTDLWGEIVIYDGDLLSNGDYIAVGSHRTLVSSNPSVFSQHRWKIFTGSSGGGFLDSDDNAGGRACSLTMLRGNKILVGGQTNGAGFGSPTLVRYNSNLTIDTTFGVNGRRLYDGTTNLGIDLRYIASLKTQPDGKILGTTEGGNIVRFNSDGSLDKSFARIREDVADNLSLRGVLSNYRYTTPFPVPSGGDQRIVFGGVSFGSDGKLVTSGCVACPGNVTLRGVVTRLKTSFRSGGTFADFNNDGKADLSVFRPTGGVWHSLDSFDGNYTPAAFGLATDKIAPADYDGDGKTDRAIFRDGVWYVFQSSNNQVRIFQWGSAGDLPRPGDFNGDGQADYAVFRPSNGTWYIYYSNPIQPGNVAFNVVQFGANGDAPVMGDFDGDGKSDVAVFRNGVWYYIRSSNGSIGILQFGIAGDIPTVGDYDGDGKADVSVFRNGVWYVLRSSDGGATIVGWGQAGDKAVPGDYDNDGKSDFAIYRSGVWWILRSGDGGYSATSFGLATDIPIPAAYLP